MERRYEQSLNWFIPGYKTNVVIGFTIVIVLITFETKLGTKFLPELDEGSIFLRGNIPVGITIQEKAKYAPKIREVIGAFPQVDYVIVQTGRNHDRTDPFPANRNDVQRPLATVNIGGLTSTLIFAPIRIPPLYWWANKNRKIKQKKDDNL